MLAIFLYMYFPDRGCVHTLLTWYVYATVELNISSIIMVTSAVFTAINLHSWYKYYHNLAAH